MAQLVEGHRLPFEWLENVSHELDGEVPQDGNGDDVAAKDADGDLLCVRGECERGAAEDEGWAGGDEGAWYGGGNGGRHYGALFLCNGNETRDLGGLSAK